MIVNIISQVHFKGGDQQRGRCQRGIFNKRMASHHWKLNQEKEGE